MANNDTNTTNVARSIRFVVTSLMMHSAIKIVAMITTSRAIGAIPIKMSNVTARNCRVVMKQILGMSMPAYAKTRVTRH